MRKTTTVLVILDGWGVGANDTSNPIYAADPKNLNNLKASYPYGVLQASGIAVGLPWGENGDSEVGHLTLGAGKVVYQHYPRISLKIKDGSFFKNEAILEAIKNAKVKGRKTHLVGLVGKSNIHSSSEHLTSLIEMVRANGIEPILHIFTDGRDSQPKSAGDIIADLPQIKIASVSGRFFAMDRDLHWERTTKTYKTLLGEGESVANSDNVNQLLASSYSRGLTDEFIEPTLLLKEERFQDGDSIIFFNYSEDSMKQLATMFSDPEAGEKHQIPKDLYIVTFTKYGREINFPVAFPADAILDPIGKVISDEGMVQLRIAETEKYAHITYFFNGLVEAPFKNEYRVLIPSKNIARHDEAPEMMAREITTRVVEAIGEGVYDFILVNYANADIMGHTGNFDAAIRAIKTLDEQIGTLSKEVLSGEGTLVITADHGNAEIMLDQKTGLPETTHNPSSVPIYIVRRGYERTKTVEFVVKQEKSNIGVLSDVAPTVLQLMGIAQPEDMSGISLLQFIR